MSFIKSSFVANKNESDQTVLMLRLIGALVVRIQQDSFVCCYLIVT